MNPWKIPSTATLLLWAVHCAAFETAIAVDTGFDSNPYRISDDIGSESGLFVSTDLELGHIAEVATRGELFIETSGRFIKYDEDAEEGDRFDGKLAFGYVDGTRSSGALGLKRKLELEFGLTDRTYVDRATGLPAVSGTESIDNRYSHRDYAVKGRLDFKPENMETHGSTRFLIRGKFAIKEYVDDYSNLGLTRLDYQAYTIEPGLRHKLSNWANLKVDFPITLRVYEDRRALDLTGAEIVDSDLEYTYFRWDVGVGFKIGESFEIEPSFTGYLRRDNEDGYHDATKYGVKLATEYFPNRDSAFSFSVGYGDRSFDETVPRSNPADEADRARSTIKFNLRYERSFAKKGLLPITLFADASYQDIDNENLLYSYDRSIFRIGFIARP